LHFGIQDKIAISNIILDDSIENNLPATPLFMDMENLQMFDMQYYISVISLKGNALSLN
jgi:hypothetical protein